jgi:hypothetical protein
MAALPFLVQDAEEKSTKATTRPGMKAPNHTMR